MTRIICVCKSKNFNILVFWGKCRELLKTKIEGGPYCTISSLHKNDAHETRCYSKWCTAIFEWLEEEFKLFWYSNRERKRRIKMDVLRRMSLLDWKAPSRKNDGGSLMGRNNSMPSSRKKMSFRSRSGSINPTSFIHGGKCLFWC